jgi:vacuolar protein sorting-associated protein 54
MSEVFATINHRLSEEYTKIELPTSDAKERCVHSHLYLRPLKCGPCSYLSFFPDHRLLTDARYLHEKFSVLKAPGTPTAVLETLVADKRVATAPVSPRPTTPTPTITPSSPLSLPPTNIPLGSPRSAVQPPTKRASLFSNERLKGMLGRGTTQPQPQPPPPPISIPETASSPPPTLTREKQGGYKQVAVLLSPTPLPAEKQRDLPTTPTSVPIHATPSPLLSQVEEERPEPAAHAPNVDAVDVGADESGQRPGWVDGEIGGGVSQGNGDVMAEKAPPPPAKDGDAASVSAI